MDGSSARPELKRERKRNGQPRFERKLPEERRRTLIRATIECLKRYGQEGLSIRRISAQAKVSIGLINHHFPTKEALIAEAYRYFNSELVDKLRQAVAASGGTPREQLSAFFRASFSPPNLDSDVLAVWVVFWGMYRHSQQIQRVQNETYHGYVDLLRSMLADLERETGELRFNLRLAAIGLTALIDGLWLEWCLDPEIFEPAEAVALCEAWVERLEGA
ncbi:MAG: TetR family transcriptional regulator C-terminal domain-containing protein [Sinobacteraceae bacterium]|nr:TetR family transcriptional regulator C-terminal domain-containing protein [Nevskiaceae bacterium]